MKYTDLSGSPLYGMVSVYRVCAWRPCWRTKTIEDVCIKIEYISQRKIIVLFWSPNMAVVHTLYRMADSCLYNKQYNTWTLGDMEFIFSCSHSISHSFAALTRSISMWTHVLFFLCIFFYSMVAFEYSQHFETGSLWSHSLGLSRFSLLCSRLWDNRMIFSANQKVAST